MDLHCLCAPKPLSRFNCFMSGSWFSIFLHIFQLHNVLKHTSRRHCNLCFLRWHILRTYFSFNLQDGVALMLSVPSLQLCFWHLVCVSQGNWIFILVLLIYFLLAVYIVCIGLTFCCCYCKSELIVIKCGIYFKQTLC